MDVQTHKQYCNYCKCETMQIAETTGMRCQKCLNQNPFFNSSTDEFADYMADLIRVNGFQDFDQIVRYYDEKKKGISEFVSRLTPHTPQPSENRLVNEYLKGKIIDPREVESLEQFAEWLEYTPEQIEVLKIKAESWDAFGKPYDPAR
jgi:hypothetical protein